jgi:N-acetyl-1-D-myo-inositol-2-amino-2-deoxy-alpha-D-glucopyranoside deacetylase
MTDTVPAREGGIHRAANRCRLGVALPPGPPLAWAGLRVLFVHAHPDDEATQTAVTAAMAAWRGAETALVCLTSGDRGEIAEPSLRARVAAARPSADAGIRRLRHAELRRSARLLGFRHVVTLGYGDSGMQGSPDNARAECLWQRWRSGDPGPADRLAQVLRRLRPHVVVGYDGDGGYGHPDHVAAHHLTAEAVRVAADPERAPARGSAARDVGGDPPHQVAKLYHSCLPASAGRCVLDEAAAAGIDLDRVPSAGLYYRGTVADSLVTTVVDGPGLLPVKRAALRAYRSQITADFPLLWDLEAHPRLRAVAGREHFHLAATWGLPDPPPAAGRLEPHLFTGLEHLAQPGTAGPRVAA